MISDNETVNENLNTSDIDLEYVYLDVLNDENDEIRPINNTNDGDRSTSFGALKPKYLFYQKLFL